MAYFDDPYADETDPYVAWARAQQQFALPGELAKHGDVSAPPPPPPPPPPQTFMQPGAPVQEEVPQQALQQQQPEPMQVDAVSQAAPAPQVADIVNVQQEPPAQPQPLDGYAPDAYIQHMQQVAADEALPSARDNIVEAATVKGVDAMSPEQFIQYTTDREGKLIAEKARLEHEAELANMERARQDVEIQRAATAKANADMQDVLTRAHELSLRSVNPDRYKQQHGIGRTVLDVVSSVFSGLGGNADGAMRMMDARINRDIEAQAADIQNGWKGVGVQQNAIGEEYARHGDVYRAGEVYRLAAYQSAINDIDTQLQMYDPAGSTAIRGRLAREQFVAGQQQAIQALYDKQNKDAIELAKAQAQIAKDLAEAENKRAQTMKTMGALGGGKAVKPVKFEDTPMTLDQLRAFGVAIPTNVAEPPGGLSVNQAKKLADTGKSGEEWVKVARENSPEDRARQLSVGEIVDDNGDPVKFRSTEIAAKVADTKAAVDTVSQLADEMIDLYNEHGFEPDFLKSEGWKQAQGAFATALLTAKTADQLGALSGSDLDLEAKQITGGVDVTGVRDPTSALQSFKRRMAAKVNAQIRAQAVLPKGRQVQPWSPPNTAASTMPKAEVTPEQKLVEEITAFDPKRSINARDLQSLGIDPSSVKAQGGRLNTEVTTALEKAGGVPPRIKRQIDGLRAMLNDADPKKVEFATQALSNIGKDALDPNVKAYATANAFDPADVAGSSLSKEEVR